MTGRRNAYSAAAGAEPAAGRLACRSPAAPGLRALAGAGAPSPRRLGGRVEALARGGERAAAQAGGAEEPEVAGARPAFALAVLDDAVALVDAVRHLVL